MYNLTVLFSVSFPLLLKLERTAEARRYRQACSQRREPGRIWTWTFERYGFKGQSAQLNFGFMTQKLYNSVPHVSNKIKILLTCGSAIRPTGSPRAIWGGWRHQSEKCIGCQLPVDIRAPVMTCPANLRGCRITSRPPPLARCPHPQSPISPSFFKAALLSNTLSPDWKRKIPKTPALPGPYFSPSSYLGWEMYSRNSTGCGLFGESYCFLSTFPQDLQESPVNRSVESSAGKRGEEMSPLLSVSLEALGEASFSHHEDPCSSASRNVIIFNCYVPDNCAHTESYHSQDLVLIGCVLMCVGVMNISVIPQEPWGRAFWGRASYWPGGHRLS